MSWARQAALTKLPNNPGLTALPSMPRSRSESKRSTSAARVKAKVPGSTRKLSYFFVSFSGPWRIPENHSCPSDGQGNRRHARCSDMAEKKFSSHRMAYA
jgi:hypothetical protein